jgi:hypothetical protein
MLKKLVLLLVLVMVIALNTQTIAAADYHYTYHLYDRFVIDTSAPFLCENSDFCIFNYRTEIVKYNHADIYINCFVARDCGEAVVVDPGVPGNDYYYITVVE